MPRVADGPSTTLFKPLKLAGNTRLDDLRQRSELSQQMREAAIHAPSGRCVHWGIPFNIGRAVFSSRTHRSL